MTSALLSHSERLSQAHMTELQGSLELQRQYALMRLLRGSGRSGQRIGVSRAHVGARAERNRKLS